jgi:hypothetical protein
MAALLVVAFFANLAVSPVSAEHAERGAPEPRRRTPTPEPAHT